jgi:predicted homoserine dehydrogenase-like protein
MIEAQKKPIRVGMVGAGYMTKLHSLSMSNLAALTGNAQLAFIVPVAPFSK